MKKLFYIANVRLPTEKAHGLAIMKMCEAFARQGVEVELIIPKRKNSIKENPFEYYGVEENFKITRLWCLDLVSWGRVGFWVETFTFAERVAWYSFFKRGVYYTREEFLAFYLKIFGKKVFWESHAGHDSIFVKYLIFTQTKIVVITQALKKLYIKMGLKEENILVAPDAVDIEQFDIKVSKTEVREKLCLPQDKKIAMYAGHLYKWKGVDTLAEAAKGINNDTLVVFVGGTEVDLERFRSEYGEVKNIMIIGQKPHKDIPYYLKASDMLVLPNSAEEDISRLYTSPLKLFEYMASGVPIVASDLQSIREVLNESNANFFEPDNPESLVGIIKEVSINYEKAITKSVIAYNKIKEYSWKIRVEKMLNFIYV